MFVVVFAALWSTWTAFVVYADIAGEGTRVAVLLAGAGLIGLMTTALGDLDDRGATFALGIVLCRAIAASASRHTGRLLTSWPASQLGGLSVLWIASIWIDAPARYWVWGVAVAAELLLAVGRAAEDEGDAQALVARVNARLDGRRRPDRRSPPEVVAIREREDHVGERLGLFMIIVLGEGVTEVVHAGSVMSATLTTRLGEAAAFLMLAALWWLIFHHRAGPGADGPALRIALPLHLLATGALVLVAAALGRLVLDIGGTTETFWRWSAAGGIAAWFAVVALLAAFGWTALAPRATARPGSPAS